jgi:hypothetical protein
MDDPIVHVTIYSEINSSVVFDVFVEQHGYDVQLDTENLLYVWRAIANADFVNSSSHEDHHVDFNFGASMLPTTTNDCIVYLWIMGTYEVPCHWELALWTQEIVRECNFSEFVENMDRIIDLLLKAADLATKATFRKYDISQVAKLRSDTL